MLESYEVSGAMQVLYIAKAFYDHGKLEQLLGCTGDLELCWDNQGLIEQEALGCIFEQTGSYWQYGKRVSRSEYEPDREALVFRDPKLTRYDALCREYERQRGIEHAQNPYFRRLEDTIHREMQLPSYSYDYFFRDGTKDRKGAKLILLLYEEFDAYYSLPEALFNILDLCEEGIKTLEQELAQSKPKVIDLPTLSLAQIEKEAA